MAGEAGESRSDVRDARVDEYLDYLQFERGMSPHLIFERLALVCRHRLDKLYHTRGHNA